MTNLIDRLRAGIAAFRESFVTAKLDDIPEWDDYNSRRVRYSLLWASYMNDTYRDVHKNARAYRRIYSLYKSIRSLRNPTFAIAENLKTHIWGGPLSTGIPIYTEDPRITEAIDNVFKWSQWQSKKDLVVLYGAVLGDVGIKVIDALDKVYLEVVSPDTIKDVTLDSYGNVKGYVIQETREHPEREGLEVTYTEECTRDGQLVVYRTYLDNDLYAWNTSGNGEPVAEWSEGYGFVPLVMVKNIDLGFDYGFAETAQAQSRIRELDDLTSLLSDQVRKSVNPLWLYTGVKDPGNLSTAETTATANRPEPWREEQRSLYTTNENAKAQALIANLDIENTLKHIDEVYKSLEVDYPELKLSEVAPDTNISGRALRLARQPVESKVIERRAIYDAKLEAALKMAISIGGMRGIFSGFGLDSYEKGDEEFIITARPIFSMDPEDEAIVHKNLLEGAKLATELGISLESYLKFRGYSDEELEELLEGYDASAREERGEQVLRSVGE